VLAKRPEYHLLKVQTLVVSIQAEESRAQDMLERLDRDALRGLLR
jgi:hypothetical protein